MDNLEWLCQWCGLTFNELSEHFPRCPKRPPDETFPRPWNNAPKPKRERVNTTAPDAERVNTEERVNTDRHRHRYMAEYMRKRRQTEKP